MGRCGSVLKNCAALVGRVNSGQINRDRIWTSHISDWLEQRLMLYNIHSLKFFLPTYKAFALTLTRSCSQWAGRFYVKVSLCPPLRFMKCQLDFVLSVLQTHARISCFVPGVKTRCLSSLSSHRSRPPGERERIH